MNTSPMSRVSRAAFAAACVLGGIAMFQSPAAGLSGPLQGGKNERIWVTQTLTRIASTNQKCAVTLSNIDVYTKQFPVFTGYGQYDGGPITASGIPICDGTLTTVAACPSTTLVRDAVPGAIFVQGLVGFIPDGGIPVRVELATGCSP